MNENLLTEYLAKIRAVEQLEKDTEQANRDSGGSSEMTASYSGEVPSLDMSTFKIPSIKTWPDKIQLPTGKRGDYNILAYKYASGIDVTNSSNFVQPNSARFDVQLHGFKGDGYVRADMAYYLDELYNLLLPKIGMKKLTITSSFRTKAHNDKIYANRTHKVEYSPHMAGIAVDIAATGKNRYIIADTAWNMGFGGIAVGENFVHLDINGRWTWAYDPVPEYKGPGRWYG